MRGELGIAADRRAEQQPERRAVADRELEVRAKSGLDPFAARRRPAGRVGEPVEQAAPGVLEQLDVERALAREVLVQHRLGDARRLRDVVHRRVVEARAREAVARDGEELLATFVGGKTHAYGQTLDFNGMT